MSTVLASFATLLGGKAAKVAKPAEAADISQAAAVRPARPRNAALAMHGSPPQKQQQLTANDASPPDPLRSPEPQPLADGDRRAAVAAVARELRDLGLDPAAV